MTNNKEQNAYKKAKKRLDEERGFYMHVIIYVVMNIAITIFQYALDGNKDWLIWVITLRPLLWGTGLLCHGLWTFRRNIKWFKNTIYSKQWEERKIMEIMKDDDFKF
ncbi:2TM domain-containing protein [Aquimarina algiphila]|uniref:2TM domain-containing protein n=1 Tax=Aquimarina algiphila TaxID=2047982 RepID=UPI00232FDFAB|nr:2TM domain-containing protein [Aquimarina algiphila]